MTATDLETLTQSHGAFTEFKVIVQEKKRCVNLTAEVSDLGTQDLMVLVLQLIIINCNGCLIPSIDQTLRRPAFGARHCGSLLNTACFLD